MENYIDSMSKAAIEYVLTRCSEKIQELMPEDEYLAWSVDVAKGAFHAEIEECPDNDFKDFVLKNWEKITNDTDDNNTGL